MSKTIDIKLAGAIALAMTLVFAGIFTAVLLAVSLVNDRQEERAQMLRDLNTSLRQTISELQAAYLAVPAYLQVDPVAAVSDWAASQDGAESREHAGREAIVARYSQRRARRDVQARGRFVIDAPEGAVAVSYGLFDGDSFSGTVREIRIPEAELDTVKAEIEALVEANSGADALQRRIAALTGKLADEALTADEARTAILSAVDGIARKETEVEKLVRFLNLGMLLLGGFGVVAAVGTVYLVARRVVTTPLRTLAGAAEAIAKRTGDSTPHIGRKDEIGDLARCIADFKEVLAENDRFQETRLREHEAREKRTAAIESLIRAFGRDVGQISKAVADAASEMCNNAESLEQLAVENGQRAETVTTAAADASSHVRNAAVATEQLGASIEQVAKQVGDSVSTADGAVTYAVQTDATVRKLNDAAVNVDRIIQIIDDIAGQTNLLALNATIEAARAGDAGKGFAVVASEVKGLAGQTEKATTEIGNQINSMREAIDETVAAIGQINGAISRLNQTAGQTASVVSEERTASSSILDGIGRAATITNDLSTTIAAVSEASARNRMMTGQVHKASVDMARQAEALNAEVTRFISDIRAVSN